MPSMMYGRKTMAARTGKDISSQPPIGDPPPRKQPLRATRHARDKQVDVPMMDPFTEQATQPAGDGQGANAPGDTRAEHADRPDDGGDEETMPITEGFSAVP
jgi:hypothetical protein